MESGRVANWMQQQMGAPGANLAFPEHPCPVPGATDLALRWSERQQRSNRGPGKIKYGSGEEQTDSTNQFTVSLLGYMAEECEGINLLSDILDPIIEPIWIST